MGDAGSIVTAPRPTTRRRTNAALSGDKLDAAILRSVRQMPSNMVDLAPLAEELGVDPIAIQLAIGVYMDW